MVSDDLSRPKARMEGDSSQPLHEGPSASPHSAKLLHDTSTRHQVAYKQTSSLESLIEAIEMGIGALEATDANDPDYCKYLASLAELVLLVYRVTECDRDLEDAFEQSSKAYLLSKETKHLARCSNILSTGLLAKYDRYDRNRNPKRLDLAIQRADEAVKENAGDQSNAPKFLNDLALSLCRKCEGFGDAEAIKTALDYLKPLMTTLDLDHPDRGLCMATLGGCLLTSSIRTRSFEDLDMAISCLEESVRLAPPGFADRPGRLANLGIALIERYKRAGNLEDLNEAVKMDDESTRWPYSIGHSLRAALFNNLSSARLELFNRLGNYSELLLAINAVEEAVKLVQPIKHPNLSLYHSQMCIVLLRKTERDRRHHGRSFIQDLNIAIKAGEDAVNGTVETGLQFPIFQLNLGNALLQRYEEYGREADLTSAIDVYTTSYNMTDPNSPHWSVGSGSLACAWSYKFERSG